MNVGILGDPDVRVTIAFDGEPVTQVLAKIEAISGVQLEIDRTTANRCTRSYSLQAGDLPARPVRVDPSREPSPVVAAQR